MFHVERGAYRLRKCRVEFGDIVAETPLPERVAARTLPGVSQRAADVGQMALWAVDERMGWEAYGLVAGTHRCGGVEQEICGLSVGLPLCHLNSLSCGQHQ